MGESNRTEHKILAFPVRSREWFEPARAARKKGRVPFR
jgi:hypothetical protein